MSGARRRWLGFAVVALVAGAMAIAWPRERIERAAPVVQVTDAGAPPVATAAGETEPVAEPAAPSSPPPPPPVSASAPPGCPEDEPESAGFVRPSLWELLRLRTQELRDRLPQLSRDASPELREGLTRLGDEEEEALALLASAPDRVRDGFDVAIAGRLHAGMRALGRRDARTAHRHAAVAVREDASDPIAQALLALASGELADPTRSRDALDRAYALADDEPAIALAHARAQAEAAHFDRALRAADVYLDAVPEDVRLRSWRERMASRAELTAGHVRASRAGIDVLYPRDAVGAEPLRALFDTVRTTLDEVARRTGHARRAELAVVVYADRDAMRRATCTPEWTGAVFDGVLHLHAQTLSHPVVASRVLRHEATHAQLARIHGLIPHWLNEGFAQWMEGPPSEGARASWRRMTERRFWIPFASLEGGLLVIDEPRDAELAYHQSLAMVRYLIHRRGERAIGEAVERIERGEHEDLLQALLGEPASGEDLLSFLAREP